jgi:hypothetical protein
MNKKEFEQRARETSEYQLAPDGKGNTQLPAEVVEEIKLKAKAFAVWMWPIATNHAEKQRKYVAAVHEAGATEYATKLHQAEQEIAQLKQWQIEAIAVLDPILEYGRSKEAAIPLGKSITNTVLERCKQFDAARALLEKVIYRHEGGLLPNRFIYNEIKTFLDGK